MKYYLHDSNSFNDEKVTELFTKFGFEGLGLFYTILEKLAQQEKPVKTEVLKRQLNVGKRLNRCWEFMEQIGIISSSNGDTFNTKLLSYSGLYQIKKQKTAERVANFRAKQEDVTHYDRVSNAHKVKESKVKESKVNIIQGFTPPTIEQVSIYCLERNNGVDANKFVDFYTSKGWTVGKNKMKDWQACIRTWEKPRQQGIRKTNVTII